MWNTFRCTTGTGRSCYMGFAQVHENILSYLLETPDSVYTQDHYHLVRRNFETFNALCASVMRRAMAMKRKMQQEQQQQQDHEDDCSRTDDGAEEDEVVPCQIRLVEPRELLHLLNYIETYQTRLLFAPRPFYRSNAFCLTSLVQMEYRQLLGCIVCGKTSSYSYPITNDLVCFTTLTAQTCDVGLATQVLPGLNLLVSRFPAAEIGGRLCSNESEPTERRTVCAKPLFANWKYLHHGLCPVAWLHKDENARWNYKGASFTLRGVSKFHHLMQFLTVYPRPRDSASWLSLVNRMSLCDTPGASRYTLENLFRILCHERLTAAVGRIDEIKAMLANGRVRYDTGSVTVATNDEDDTPPADFYQEPMHASLYVVDVVNPADETPSDGGGGFRGTVQLGEILPTTLPFGGSHAVLAPAREFSVSAEANRRTRYRTAHRRFAPQRHHFGKGLGPEVVSRVFTGGRVKNLHYFRLLFLHGYLLDPLESQGQEIQLEFVDGQNRYQRITDHHVCLYCGAVFRDRLTSYKYSMVYFPHDRAELLVKYALYGADEKCLHQRVYGRHLAPVHDFQATFPKDLSPAVLNGPPSDGTDESDHLREALVWLSASMDRLHTDDCVFRIKKRFFENTRCCVCLVDGEEFLRATMVCGHELCISCYNEVSITSCCLCKRGYRTEHLTVSDSVLRGYVNARLV